jgi:predicted nucleic acid-binding protein
LEKVSAQLQKYKTIGLDTLCFIYHFEENAAYLPFTTELFNLIEKGKLTAVCSAINYLEVLVGPKKQGLNDVVSFYRFVFHSFPNLILAKVDAYIADLASDLRAKYNLKAPDAINLACSLAHKAECFITNDRMLSRVKEIRVLLMKDLI